MIEVVSYTACLPPKTRSDSSKASILRSFAQGVCAAGDQGMVQESAIYLDSQVGVILGWVHEHGKQAPHLQFRQDLVDQYRNQQRHVVIVDSNLFLYADQSNPHHVLRYSFDGVFPNTGNYCDQNIDPSRWQRIAALMNITVKPYRSSGDHILLCLQRDGGWSMGGTSVDAWAVETIRRIRKFTTRPIRCRSHPGDKRAESTKNKILSWSGRQGLGGIVFSDCQQVSLIKDLQDCWAMVNHNSSPAVAALIEGIPVFVTDPERSQCSEVANHNLKRIEDPEMPERQSWLARLAQFHWSEQEVRNGECWRHMRSSIMI